MFQMIKNDKRWFCKVSTHDLKCSCGEEFEMSKIVTPVWFLEHFTNEMHVYGCKICQIVKCSQAEAENHKIFHAAERTIEIMKLNLSGNITKQVETLQNLKININLILNKNLFQWYNISK